MRRLASILALIVVIQLSAQNAEKEAVMKVVKQVFTAMKTNDADLLKDAFVESPATYTVFNTPQGETKFQSGDFQKFVDAVGMEKTDVWNEPIWDEKVEIDEPLAQVWVDYAFYINDKFSHCGVDAFHLVKQDGKWRIFHLVDTRRRASCEVPDEVKKEYGG